MVFALYHTIIKAYWIVNERFGTVVETWLVSRITDVELAAVPGMHDRSFIPWWTNPVGWILFTTRVKSMKITLV
jgi:hypothetical protein